MTDRHQATQDRIRFRKESISFFKFENGLDPSRRMCDPELFEHTKRFLKSVEISIGALERLEASPNGPEGARQLMTDAADLFGELLLVRRYLPFLHRAGMLDARAGAAVARAMLSLDTDDPLRLSNAFFSERDSAENLAQVTAPLLDALRGCGATVSADLERRQALTFAQLASSHIDELEYALLKRKEARAREYLEREIPLLGYEVWQQAADSSTPMAVGYASLETLSGLVNMYDSKALPGLLVDALVRVANPQAVKEIISFLADSLDRPHIREVGISLLDKFEKSDAEARERALWKPSKLEKSSTRPSRRTVSRSAKGGWKEAVSRLESEFGLEGERAEAIAKALYKWKGRELDAHLDQAHQRLLAACGPSLERSLVQGNPRLLLAPECLDEVIERISCMRTLIIAGRKESGELCSTGARLICEGNPSLLTDEDSRKFDSYLALMSNVLSVWGEITDQEVKWSYDPIVRSKDYATCEGLQNLLRCIEPAAKVKIEEAPPEEEPRDYVSRYSERIRALLIQGGYDDTKDDLDSEVATRLLVDGLWYGGAQTTGKKYIQHHNVRENVRFLQLANPAHFRPTLHRLIRDLMIVEKPKATGQKPVGLQQHPDRVENPLLREALLIALARKTWDENVD